MSADDRERLARAYLLMAGRLGDRDVADLVWQFGPALAAELVAASSDGAWEQDATAAMEQCRSKNLRLVVPGDEEWPAALASDPWTAPLGLWVRGAGRLNDRAAHAIGIAGRTDATPYGTAAACELGRHLAVDGWTVVTLGRFGIDSAALRGALQDPPVPEDPGPRTPPPPEPRPAASPPMVLPLGRLVEPQPPLHERLFQRVGWDGVLVSQHGANVPARHGRPDVRRQIRLLVALVASVVVVEPDGRGWDNRLVRTAQDAGRPVLTVPGPITSEESRFSHELVRAGRARLINGDEDFLSELERSHR